MSLLGKEQVHSSESDESDEEFIPGNELAGESDALSEDSSGEEVSSAEDEEEGKERNGKKKPGKRNSKRKSSPVLEKRTERVRTRNSGPVTTNGRQDNEVERNALESEDEEEDKSQSDALWAEFLGTTASSTTPTEEKSNTVRPKLKPAPSRPVQEVPTPLDATVSQAELPRDTEIAELLQSAGGSIEIRNSVNAADPEGSNTSALPELNVRKRPLPSADGAGGGGGGSGGGGGLGSVLGNLMNKKKKVSVLTKSQMDWSSFKQETGIAEELTTHNKGKDGYIERQNFLQRTDLRQFEIERELRQTRRKK